MTQSCTCSSNVAFTSASMLGGAEAVNAINGALVRALNPPSCVNAVLNFSPLFLCQHTKLVTHVFKI